jgi:hypothetical protein
MEEGYSGYLFPCSAKQQATGVELRNALTTGTDDQAVHLFHQFISPILFAPEMAEQILEGGSKWNDMIECLMAVKFVQEDGNFPQAKDITQPLAQLLYLIRGAVLYEGIQTLDQHSQNLTK